ncbi:MAG TPA: cytochrome c [Burkholderiales bacterium]|nr:cytochrome c [Burkholderiales bacterium]
MRVHLIAQVAVTLAMTLSSVLSACAADGGLYSATQAARGEALYEQYCMACHGAKLQGNPAAPLAGPVFQGRWADGQHTLDDLFYIVRTQMPYSAPGSLAKQQYADVIAYVLKMNGYDEGETELTPIASTLKKITLQPR